MNYLSTGMIMKIQAKAIIFDQGNTLIIDPFSGILELHKHEFRGLCAKYGVEVSEKELTDQWIKANREVDFPYLSHFMQEEPIVQRALAGLKVAEETAAQLGLELLKEYRACYQAFIRTDPRTAEVRETLGELKKRGKRLGVFSNDRVLGLGMALNLMAIRPLFEYVETSESTGFEKPDPRVFEHIIAHFGLAPEEIVYVGDDQIRDIDAAKKHGLKAVWYKVDSRRYSEPWRDYEIRGQCRADAGVNSFSELLAVLE